MTAEWINWSGSVTCQPARMATPGSEAEVAALVRQAADEGRRVRVCGSGHSFVPLCATDDVLLSLEQLAGIESADSERLEATIRAGTKIHDLGEPLRAQGLALANQGDVDVQALAGAISTGTHGTGRALGSLSTQVVGLRFVNAAGEVITCSPDENADVFSAAHVSLGTLGVVTALRMRLLPAYCLHEHTWQEPIEACLDQLAERIASNRHFEFFWYSATDLAHAKALNPTTAEPDEMPDVAGQRIDHSDRIFPTVRSNRFNEMEYSVPYDAGPGCFREIRALMRAAVCRRRLARRVSHAGGRRHRPEHGPGRETVTLSIHQSAAVDPRTFFADAEAIFRAHDGRPHWAKMHSQRADQLAPLYPRWSAFHAVRRRLDPRGVFTNDYLRRVFGDASAP